MKFYVADCPEDQTIFDWVCANSNFIEATKDVKPSMGDVRHLFFDYVWDLGAFSDTGREVVARNGFIGWMMSGKGRVGFYGGLSLTYNPAQQEGFAAKGSTLGTTRFRDNGNDPMVGGRKNSYDDTLAFSTPTEVGMTGEFGKITQQIIDNGFSPVRGRLSVMDAVYGQRNNEYLWHCDESVFENLRINIPCCGYEDYEAFGFQMDGEEPYPIYVGKGYSWNTQLRHRPVLMAPSKKQRVNLLLGVTPWLRLSEDKSYWEFNEHFGKTHPFDLLATGKITDCLRFDSAR